MYIGDTCVIPRDETATFDWNAKEVLRGSCAVDQETLLGDYLDTENVAEELQGTSTLLVVKGTALLAYEQRCCSSKK